MESAHINADTCVFLKKKKSRLTLLKTASVIGKLGDILIQKYISERTFNNFHFCFTFHSSSQMT